MSTHTLQFIVHGEDVDVTGLHPNTHLATARRRALALSENLGRPAEAWEIRDERGVLVDPTTRVGALPRFARLYLCLPVGYGGACEVAA